jgi:5-methylcytosine-specific restriction enzyme subunit McrC
MEKAIRLQEHQQQTVSLSAAQLTALRQTLSGKIKVWPTDEPGRYVLQAGSHVGFLALPGDRALIIEPKVTIETLFALLAAVYDPGREVFRDEPQDYTTVEALFEFVVRVFVRHVEDLVARGILRGYRSIVDDPAAVRGRLLFSETLHRRPVLRDRHWCAHSHFTPDVLENRILRWASFCLQPCRYQETNLPGRLRRISLALSDAALDPEARQLFERLAFHRLNDPYRPALALARLLLDHLTFSGTSGGEPFLAYLVDMNWLFERYVGAVLKRAARGWGIEVIEQDAHYLDTQRQVTVKPDVMLSHRGIPLLVIDAKYKLADDQGDIYQLLAYCHALGIREGVLVHPAHDQAPSGTLIIRGPGDVRLRYLVLDLHGGLVALERQGQRLAEQVAEMLDLGTLLPVAMGGIAYGQ